MMTNWFKGVFGMSSVADDRAQKPKRVRHDTSELDARSFARQHRATERVEKVDRLVSELSNESSEPLSLEPTILFPPEQSAPDIPIMIKKPAKARRMKSDFVIRTKARAVVNGDAGDWVVEYPGGDLAVYTDADFKKWFQTIP